MEMNMADTRRKAMALKKLLELSEADAEAGRLLSTREAFERASRVIDDRGSDGVAEKRRK
jgi:hypothetical protein